MVADDVGRPSAGSVGGSDLAAEFGRIELVDAREHKVHRHLKLFIFAAVVLLELGDVLGPRFADQHGIRFVRDLAEVLQHVVNFGKLCVVFVFGFWIAELGGARKNRIVTEVGIFEQRVDCVQPEAGDAALVPPARHIEHGFLDCGIIPVQVWLLGVEVVVVELVRDRIELPG